MADTRTTRDAATREKTERPKRWQRASLLPDVNPEEGYAYRYIRTSVMGNADPMNVSSKFREGWEPVNASEHPEAYVMADPNSRFKDSIESGGLLLCKIPQEFVEQRDEHFRKQTEDAVVSVDNNFMRESDPRMPLFKDKKTSVTFGKGNIKS